MEATGVELFSVLTIRKLLIPGSATTAKKAPSPDPLYVYCTKTLFALESRGHPPASLISHTCPGTIENGIQLPTLLQVTVYHLFRAAAAVPSTPSCASSTSSPRMREHSRRSLAPCRLPRNITRSEGNDLKPELGGLPAESNAAGGVSFRDSSFSRRQVKTKGVTISTCSRELTIPPSTGVARVFITSSPVARKLPTYCYWLNRATRPPLPTHCQNSGLRTECLGPPLWRGVSRHKNTPLMYAASYTWHLRRVPSSPGSKDKERVRSTDSF